MRRVLIAISLISVTAVSALAQQSPQFRRPVTAQERIPKARLKGVEELRYITNALKLNEEQQQHVDGLIDEFRYKTEQPGDLGHLADLLQQLKTAQADGDQEEVDRLRKALDDARPINKARREFLSGLRSVLSDAQQEKLEEVLAFLERNPSGRLRPLDVYLLVTKELELSPKQERQLVAIHTDLRRQIRSVRDQAGIPESEFPGLFLDAVRNILSDEQRATFDEKIAALVPATVKDQAVGGGAAEEPEEG